MPQIFVSKSAKPKRSPLKLSIEIVLLVIGIAVFAVVAIAVFLLSSLFSAGASLSKNCTDGRNQLFSQKQQIASEFNIIQITSDDPRVAPQVELLQGDCFDSTPSIFVTKSYDTNEPAGTVMDQITAAFANAGYKENADSGGTTSTAALNPCSYSGVTYYFSSKDSRVVAVTLTCTSLSKNGQDWRTIPISKVTAELTATPDN